MLNAGMSGSVCVCVCVRCSFSALLGSLGQMWLGLTLFAEGPGSRGRLWIIAEEEVRRGGGSQPVLWAGLSLSPSFFPVPQESVSSSGTPHNGTPSSTARGTRTASAPRWRQLPRYQQDRPHEPRPPVMARGPGLGTEAKTRFQAQVVGV